LESETAAGSSKREKYCKEITHFKQALDELDRVNYKPYRANKGTNHYQSTSSIFDSENARKRDEE